MKKKSLLISSLFVLCLFQLSCKPHSKHDSSTKSDLKTSNTLRKKSTDSTQSKPQIVSENPTDSTPVALLSESETLLDSAPVLNAVQSIKCTNSDGNSFYFQFSEDWSQIDGRSQKNEDKTFSFSLPCQSSNENKTVRCEGLILDDYDSFNIKWPGVFVKEEENSFSFKFLPWPTPKEKEYASLEIMDVFSESFTSLIFTCSPA